MTDAVIERVKERAKITEVVGEYTTLQPSGKTLKGFCPFHTNVNTPAFYVYPESDSWYCYGCNSGGDVFAFLEKLHSVSFGDALRMLAEKYNIPVTLDPEAERRAIQLKHMYEINETAAIYWHAQLTWGNHPEVLHYLNNQRKINLDSIIKFRLGYTGREWNSTMNHLLSKGFTEKEIAECGLIRKGEVTSRYLDFFRDRIMFPIQINGKVNGFGGRVLPGIENGVKFLNTGTTEVFKKKASLFALSQAKATIRSSGVAVIVEGYIDAVILHQVGIENTVSTMGTAITPEQLKLLSDSGAKKIILAMDGDEAGVNASIMAATQAASTHLYIASIPYGKDPDDLAIKNPEELKLILDQADPYISYLIKKAPKNMDAPQKGDFSNRIMPLIDAIGNPVEQVAYQIELMEALEIKNYRPNPRCPHCGKREHSPKEQKKWRQENAK